MNARTRPPFRLGLLGCAGIAFWAHLRSFPSLPRFEPTLARQLLRHRVTHLLRPGHDPSYRLALDGFANALHGLPDTGAHASDGWSSLATALAAEHSASVGHSVPVLPS